jgi:hypothetical protein
MKSRIAILAKPVQEYRLFRDGRLKTQSTYESGGRTVA